MEGKELMEAKLQAIEEKLAHYEDLHNRGKLSQEDYEILISEGKKEAERVKEIGSVEPDEEHAEAREIWADVQKQFAEGKLSKEEFEKYKKMFEHYKFDAPKDPSILPMIRLICGLILASVGAMYVVSKLKRQNG